MVDLLGIISFFLLSLVVRKLVVGYLKDTNAGECCPSVGWAIQKNLTDTLYSSAVKALAKCRPTPGGVIALGGKGPVEHAGPICEIGFSPI